MAQSERPEEAERNPDFEASAPPSTRPSMLYHVLPAVITSRIPTIPSFRQSLAGNKHVRSSSLPDMSIPGTPPPDYSSRPSSGWVTPLRLSNDSESEFLDAVSEQGSTSSDIRYNTFENKTGIKWRYASLGMCPGCCRSRPLLTRIRRKSDESSPSRSKSPDARPERLVTHSESTTVHTWAHLPPSRSTK